MTRPAIPCRAPRTERQAPRRAQLDPPCWTTVDASRHQNTYDTPKSSVLAEDFETRGLLAISEGRCW